MIFEHLGKRAIIIAGPRRSGKSTLAKAIAGTRSTLTLTMKHFKNAKFNSGLVGEPVVIIEEFTFSRSNMDFIKAFVTEDTVLINTQGKDVSTIPTPNLILVTDMKPKFIPRSRHFELITIKGTL